MKKLPPISVLIADDHPIVREGLVAVIQNERGLRVVAEAASWPQAIQCAALHRPQLAILDLHMPGMEATDAIPEILKKSPGTRIIALTAFHGDEDIYRALRAGACGYLPKEAGKEALLDCIRAVQQGQTWVHPSAASALADRIQSPDVTPREREVLDLMAAGRSNKEIGMQLGVTEGTVKVHVNHLFAKLGVDGRVAASMLALKRGIVQLPARQSPTFSESNSLAKRAAG